MNGLRIFSTHSSIAPSSFNAFSPQKYSWPVGKVGNSFAAILLFSLTLKINIGGNFVLSAHTLTTKVAGECIYNSHLWSLLWVRGEGDRGFIHIDNAFLFAICLTYFFPNLLHEIECFWCFLCKIVLRFMSAHLIAQSMCLQPPVNNQRLCTIWLACLSQYNAHPHYCFLLKLLKCIAKKKIVHGLNVFSLCWMRHGWAHVPTAFSINNSIGCWCQIDSKLHPMKQKMHSSFQFLWSTHAYVWAWNFSYDPAYHLH